MNLHERTPAPSFPLLLRAANTCGMVRVARDKPERANSSILQGRGAIHFGFTPSIAPGSLPFPLRRDPSGRIVLIRTGGHPSEPRREIRSKPSRPETKFAKFAEVPPERTGRKGGGERPSGGERRNSAGVLVAAGRISCLRTRCASRRDFSARSPPRGRLGAGSPSPARGAAATPLRLRSPRDSASPSPPSVFAPRRSR
jgi:hypothetical protein